MEQSGRVAIPKALGVRVIVVGPESQGPGWSGHLILQVEAADLPTRGALVDLDLQQFRRPPAERDGVTFPGIDLPGAAWFPIEPRRADGSWAWGLGDADDPDNGPVVAYRPLQGTGSADPMGYQRARDWKRAWEPELRRDIGALVRVVRQTKKNA